MSDNTKTRENDVETWMKDIIEGCGGMNDYEEYELVIWNEPERVAAARWTLRCLANPKCAGSEYVLNAIMERRKEVLEVQS